MWLVNRWLGGKLEDGPASLRVRKIGCPVCWVLMNYGIAFGPRAGFAAGLLFWNYGLACIIIICCWAWFKSIWFYLPNVFWLAWFNYPWFWRGARCGLCGVCGPLTPLTETRICYALAGELVWYVPYSWNWPFDECWIIVFWTRGWLWPSLCCPPPCSPSFCWNCYWTRREFDVLAWVEFSKVHSLLILGFRSSSSVGTPFVWPFLSRDFDSGLVMMEIVAFWNSGLPVCFPSWLPLVRPKCYDPYAGYCPNTLSPTFMGF